MNVLDEDYLDCLVISIEENYNEDQNFCLSCNLVPNKFHSKISCQRDLGKVHHEGDLVNILFKRFSDKVIHLKNPSKGRIESALDMLCGHKDVDKPILFCYLGHGVEINDKLYCPIITKLDGYTRPLYPIEQKL